MRQSAKESFSAYTLLLPAALLFGVFVGLPAFLAIIIAFKRIEITSGITGSPWVGFQNFHDLFANVLVSERILLAFENTVLFTICFVPANLLLSLALASLVHSIGQKRQGFYRAAFYLPTVTSAIVFAMIWKTLYDPNFGLLNYFLGWFGINPINWTGDPDWAIWSVIIAAIGAGPGGNILIFLAALGSVPISNVESARVEGANALQTWWYVTLPHLKPVTLYLLVLNTIGSFQVFELVFILTSGGPAGSSTVIVYEIYDLAFGQGRYGPACALSLILLGVVSAISFLQFRFLGRDIEAAHKPGIVTSVMGAIIDGIGSAFGWIGDAARAVTTRLKRFMPKSPQRRTRATRPLVIREIAREAPVHVILLPLALLFLGPMVWMFLAAVTPGQLLQQMPPEIRVEFDRFPPQNYADLAEVAPLIGRWFWNSFYLSLLITCVQLLLSCLTGYVFARLTFPGRGILFAILIGSIMLPYQALVIPLFIVITTGIRGVLHVDLMNTHWAIILPALCSPVGIFLMRQFIMGLPKELDEAARIDGCGPLATWARVILPLCKPVLGAWGILTFTGVWRSFFWPFVVLGSEVLFTLEVGLQTLQQQRGGDFGLVMAGATVSAVPMIIIFFIFQKQIVAGLTFGAVKQ